MRGTWCFGMSVWLACVALKKPGSWPLVPINTFKNSTPHFMWHRAQFSHQLLAHSCVKTNCVLKKFTKTIFYFKKIIKRMSNFYFLIKSIYLLDSYLSCYSQQT